jgi:hypothetical protein
VSVIIYNHREQRGEKKMKKSAWYVFADGYEVWLNGMSRQEQRVLESKHGKIVEIYYD